jgi:phosphatidylserine/phosphatidylglycerophosphate/cardiolipin synthase-like enzyme
MENKWLNLFPDAKRTKADPLLDGQAYFDSVIKAIESTFGSSNFIYILGWTLDIDLQLTAGDPEKTLFKLLSKASAGGVEIRILIWDNLDPNLNKLIADAITRLGSLATAKVFIDEHTFFPQKSKRWIQSISRTIVDLVNRYGYLLDAARLEEQYDVSPSYIKYRLVNLISQLSIGAHHEKVVIVKGKVGNEDKLVGFCGGLDFNKNRVFATIKGKDYRFPTVHDAACRLEGPAAHEILQRFKRRWRNHPQAKSVSLSGENEPKPKDSLAPYPYAKVVGTYNSPDGSEKQDRSLKDAYLKIIENAKTYIYIEDQYLINLDVAKAINKKIKEPDFRKVMFAMQDWRATSDLLIPNRKWDEFGTAVLSGATQNEKEKVLFSVLDRTSWVKERYHIGMHAKTLIVDDEIAIIGSANVNQRSFTVDSETSVVVFDDTDKLDDNFARALRVATWKEMLRRPPVTTLYQSWNNYPSLIERGEERFAKLIPFLTAYRNKYDDPDDGTTNVFQDDLDERIKSDIRRSGVAGLAVAYRVLDQDLLATSAIWNEQFIVRIFDELWENIIDPIGP